MPLVLSLFPGIDLLGRAFESRGFCVVRGPDIITGGDIRQFDAPPGRFDGIIGGPPCQDFSKLNRQPTDYSHRMLDEFIRVVSQSHADWFLFENVATAPAFDIPAYHQQRFALDLAWFTDFSRLRHFVFGSRDGRLLNPMTGTRGEIAGTAVIGNDARSFRACCEIQGLPPDFDLPFFTLAAKKQAVANGVPLQLGEYVADLIRRDYYGSEITKRRLEKAARRCACGCGRQVVGFARYSSPACRKRAQRARESQQAKPVLSQ